MVDNSWLPEGLRIDTLHEAVSLIEAWELAGDVLATDLAIELYKLFCAKKGLSDRSIC